MRLGVLVFAFLFAAACDRSADGRDAGRPDAGDEADAATSGSCPDDLTACGYPSRGLALMEPPITVMATDEDTGRELPLYVRAPLEGGPFPVVLFEHGGGLRDGGEMESRAWGTLIASHGYVVVHVGHPDATGLGETLCDEAGLTPAQCAADPSVIHTIIRPRDVIAVLDDLQLVADALEDMGGAAADTARVGVAGWSGGAQAPTMIFGATRELAEGAPLYVRSDARPQAAIFLSPSGTGFSHYFSTETDSSWSAMRGPVLVMTGENDVKDVSPDLTGPVRRQAFDLAPADGTRRLLYSNLPLGVGGHDSYNLGDRDSTDPRLRRLTAAIGSAALAFLDEHLKDDAAAAAYLDSDHVRLLAGEAEYSAR